MNTTTTKIGNTPVLRVDDLSIGYETASGDFEDLVMDVTFDVAPGEVLCIVGESGSGKSLSVLAALGLLPEGPEITSGQVTFKGQNLLGLRERELSQIRGKELGMVFQDPLTSLNPVRKVGAQIARAIRIHNRQMNKREVMRRVVELLESVGVRDAARQAEAYPHQWSGGMRQRAVIAMAIANNPDVLIADEPTTALDVTVQRQIMDVLADVRAATGAAMIMITHDLGLVAQVADKIAIMYSGRIVETGTVWEIFDHPRHPYTIGLLGSLLTAENSNMRAISIPGAPPSPETRPKTGCPFAPRCTFVGKADVCWHERPELNPITSTQGSACHFAESIGLREDQEHA